MNAAKPDDSGVTLVELMIALMITGLISAVIAGAVTVGVQSTDDSNKRLAGSQGAQITSAVFAGDVQSSATIVAGPTPCSDGTQGIAVITWTDVDAALVTVTKRAEYCRAIGAQQPLRRRYHENGSFLSELVVAADTTAASLTCSPDCTTPAGATISATEVGGFTFSVTGSRRRP